MADADRFPQPAPAAGKAAATVPAGAPPPPPLEYTEPDDAAMPTAPFSLEVIKNGVVVEVLELPPTKTFVTVGRLPICDVPMEHQAGMGRGGWKDHRRAHPGGAPLFGWDGYGGAGRRYRGTTPSFSSTAAVRAPSGWLGVQARSG